MIDRSSYENIKIPENLHSVVQDAIKKGIRSRKLSKSICILKKASYIAAVFVLCVVTLLNTFPVFAAATYEIPVIGNLCRIFTFREYHLEDEITYIDAKIPKIDNTGKTALEKRLNLEIQQKINDLLEESEIRAKNYYDAFIETGGESKEFIPVGITIDYEVKRIDPQCLSFVISQYETNFSAYNSSYYYNIDMESGHIFTLKDLFGNDYRQIIANSMENTIANWDDAQKALLWNDLSVIDLISENTPFYINENNQVVVVIEKYAAAAGAAGTLEFIIQSPDK